MTQITTLADLADDLAGYRCYAPTGLAAGIDEEIAEKYPCVRCGGRRCTYRGFKGPDGTYLAFQVCGDCRHAEPF